MSDTDRIENLRSVVQKKSSRITELEQCLAERDATIAAMEHVPWPADGPTEDKSWEACGRALETILSAAPDDALQSRDAEVWDEAIWHVDNALGQETRRAAMLDNPYREQEGI